MKSEAIISKSSSTTSKVSKVFSFHGFDLGLLVVVTLLVTFGLMMVYSSSFIFAQERAGDGFAFIKKQLIFAFFGFFAMLGASKVDPGFWKKYAYAILIGAGLLLVAVLVPGVGARVGGAQRWLRLGFFNFQPSEIAKFAVIIFVARQLEEKKDRLKEFVPGVLSNILIPLPILMLLLLQPDFGSTVMIVIVVFLLMFLAGVRKTFLLSGVLGGVTLGALLIFTSPYRKMRFMTYLDPWKDPAGKGFQILQSMVGLNNGGLWGVGLGNGKEKLFYLPEAHNDFIFAVIGEELGFIGVAGVVLAYLYFIYRGLKISWRVFEMEHDRFRFYLGSGITLALGLQGFVNMAVVLGLLPTKGLTLPFISYGGSALLIDLFAIGILLSVSSEKKSSR